MAFVAAMHSRTPMIRDHHATHWKEVQDLMEEIDRNMKSASPERRRRAALISTPPSDPRKTMTLEDVRKITASPMEHTLIPYFEVELPLLLTMRCAILCTANEPGFITSDNPVVWFDPDAYKRPPLYRSPAFMYPKLQITFPLSPSHLLLLVHGEPALEYIDVRDQDVQEVNRLTRGHCDKEFVVNRDFVDPLWLDPGKMPADAWETTRAPDVPRP
jgi:hypothetical protein